MPRPAVFVMAMVFVLGNLLVDLCYALGSIPG